MNQYSLGEAARLVGRSYSQCWHAYAYGRVRWPRRVGRSFVLDEDDLAALQGFFHKIDGHGVGEVVSRGDQRMVAALARLHALERQNASCTDEPSDAFGALMREMVGKMIL